MSSSERGSWPIAMNRPVTGRSRVSPVTVSRSMTASSRSSPLISATSEFQTISSLGSANARSCMIFEARSSSRRWISVDLRPEPGQERRLLDGGVAATDDRDVLVAEEEPVTGGTPRDAAAGELLLAGQAELAVARAGGQDHRARRERVGRGLHDLDVAGEVDLDHVVGDQLGAEALGLGAHLVHQGRAHDAVAEAGEVLDLGGVHQRAAGGHRALEDQRLQRRPGGVDGCGVTRGARADDDDVAEGLTWVALLLDR